MLQIYTLDENGEKVVWFQGFQLSGWKLDLYRNIKSSLGFQVYYPEEENNNITENNPETNYCDIYLTHDSPRVRKDHNAGWKHKMHVQNYFAELDGYKVQQVVNNITKAYVYAGLGGFPELVIPGKNRQRPPLPPGMVPPGMRPPFPIPPGMPLPPGVRPPFPIPPGMPMPPPGMRPPFPIPPGMPIPTFPDGRPMFPPGMMPRPPPGPPKRTAEQSEGKYY